MVGVGVVGLVVVVVQEDLELALVYLSPQVLIIRSLLEGLELAVLRPQEPQALVAAADLLQYLALLRLPPLHRLAEAVVEVMVIRADQVLTE